MSQNTQGSMQSADDRASWALRVNAVRTFAQIRANLTANDPASAARMLTALRDTLSAPNQPRGVARTARTISTSQTMLLLSAQVADANGQTSQAYADLTAALLDKPNDAVHAAAVRYGAKLSKSPAQVDADIWQARYAKATPATPFTLGLYTEPRSVSLDTYKGKVVLLTFWFPGCGPCRGEMPHLQKALAKYQSRGFVVLAVNGAPEQDEFVLPFMQGNQYGFIPLRGSWEWCKAAYGVVGYPTNFLIDKSGRVVFKNFMVTNPESERMFDLMVEGLLERGA